MLLPIMLWLMLLPLCNFFNWLMLLPICCVGYSTTFHVVFVADVMATLYMADVVAMVADGNCHLYMG